MYIRCGKKKEMKRWREAGLCVCCVSFSCNIFCLVFEGGRVLGRNWVGGWVRVGHKDYRERKL